MIAATGELTHASSTDFPYIELDLTSFEDGEVRFPNNPGADMLQNKADLWTIPISDFRFQASCIWKDNVTDISIRNGGNDGWYINSLLTVLSDGDAYVVLSADMNVNRWVDGDSTTAGRLFLDLTLV